MLFGPPPGYSPISINRQTVGPLGMPGEQGRAAQGYDSGLHGLPGNMMGSSSIIPSSMNPTPASQGPLNPANTGSLIRALQGGARL